MKTDANSVRERILKSAVTLLKSCGIRKLAQPQIAKKAGVPQGHMTYYFPTRADLLMAVADRSLDHIAKVITKKVARAETLKPDEGLMLVEPLISDVSRTRMLMGLLVEADENPALRKKLQENLEFSYSLIGLGTGHEITSVEVRLASAAMIGLALQEFLNSKGSDSSASVTDTLRYLNQLLHAKVGKTSAASPPEKKS